MARAPRFSLGGIPVTVEPAFFVIIAILGIDPNNPEPLFIATWVGIVFVSILLHELGHAVAFRLFGVRPSITLHGFGGLTAGEGQLSPGRHIIVSLAGPLSALFLLGIPAWWLESSALVTGADARQVLSQVVWVNVGFSLLNLAPILPLDGGAVMLSILDVGTHGRGRRPAEIVSVVFATLLAVVGLATGYVFVALLAAMFAGINITSLARRKAEDLNGDLQTAHRALLSHDAAGAEQVVRRVLAKRPSGPTLQWASELLGWCRLWQGDVAGADEAIARFAHAGGPSSSFRAARALAAGQVTEGVTTMAWAFVHDPAGPAKSLGAVAAAGSGQAPAVARELILLGTEGTAAAELFQHLLSHAGYRDDAAEVARLRSMTA